MKFAGELEIAADEDDHAGAQSLSKVEDKWFLMGWASDTYHLKLHWATLLRNPQPH